MPVPRPVVNNGDAPQSVQWGHALVMFSKDRTSQQLEAAKQFLLWLEDPTNVGAYFTSQGMLPATTAGLANQQSADSYTTTWAQITATSRPDETAALPNGAQVATILGQEAEGAYYGTETPDAAVQSIASQLRQLG